MLLGARQFFERRGAPTPPLPYDAEVEYLESTGTQYIEVGAIVGVTAVESRLSAASIPDSGCYKAFGVGYNVNFGDDAGVNNVGWCSSTNVPFVADEFVLLRYDANRRYVNGTNIGGNGLAFLNGAAAGKMLFLFCGSSGTRAYITSSGNYMAWRGKIASYTVVGGNGNLRDLIPVCFTNEQGVSEGAMYDRVSGQLFRNAGTGAFTIGPDKS